MRGATGEGTPGKWLAPHDAAALTDDNELIRVDAGDRFLSAARPHDIDAIGPRARAEAHVNAQIVL